MRLPVALVCALVIVALTPRGSSAQRLFARDGERLQEIGAGPRNLGAIVGGVSLPSDCPLDFHVDVRTWPIDHGRYLAWHGTGGVCLLDTLAGTTRQLIGVGTIVAASETSFAIVFSALGNIAILNDPRAAPKPVVLTDKLPQPNGFYALIWTYAIAPTANQLVIVESQDSGDRPEPIVTRVSLTTGLVEHVARIAAPLMVNEIAVTAAGNRVVLLSDDWYYGLNGVAVVDTTTGAVIAANRTVTPYKLGNLQRAMAFDEALGRVLVVTYAGDRYGSVVLDAATMQVVAMFDVPSRRYPLQPGFNYLVPAFSVHLDAAAHTVVLLDSEAQSVRYGPWECLRAALHVIDLGTGAIAQTVDLLAPYGYLACGVGPSTFLVSPPSPPAVVTATVMASAVTLTWPASSGATHYVVEAGSGLSLANYGAFNVSGTSFTVSPVPAGRYFVRVRAVGVAGQGLRSADAIVTVP